MYRWNIILPLRTYTKTAYVLWENIVWKHIIKYIVMPAHGELVNEVIAPSSLNSNGIYN